MTSPELLHRYAELVVGVGINLQPGQRLGVGCLVEHRDLARALAARAYAAGAQYVDVLYGDRHVHRAQLELGPEDGLGWAPPWLVERLEDLAADGGAYVALSGEPQPDLTAGVAGDRVARGRMQELTRASLALTRASNWSVAACPTPGWARTVFGEPDLERLWAAVASAVRLEEADPVAAWRRHLAVLSKRAAQLNELRLDALHFRGPGTDLTVGLLPDSSWQGAETTTNGISHVPNMPTEEVFTTPDARRVSGTVASTYPLPLEGTLVRGLRVRFEAGRAVELSAETGEELIRAHVASDAGAARLGEVALVDRTSRVGELGLVFSEVLFDENAACHIAFGDAILRTVEGAAALSREEREARGINASGLHTDFMIGSPEVDVDGVTREGDAVAILRDGAFVLG